LKSRASVSARDKVAAADASSALHEAAAYGDVAGTASGAAFGAEISSDVPVDRLAPARGSGHRDPHGSSPIMLVLEVGGVLAGGILGWLAWRIRIAARCKPLTG
jgi:hypothetical protein